MAIKTSTFGSVTLTGGVAKAFKKQFIDNPAPPSKEAIRSIAHGRKLAKELDTKGFIEINNIKK